MTKILIKPLSVNQCWQGKRYKTKTYKSYEKELLLKLPFKKISNSKIRIDVTFGFSNSLSDIDNGLKPFLDILQKKYNINDRNIYQLNVTKEVVKKGSDFILFKIIDITT